MLGERIKNAREKNCMSQEALAEAVGMHTNTIARWERNEVIPRGNSLKRLSQALHVQPSYLLDTERNEGEINENINTPNLKKENAKIKETASESISPLCLSYTGINGDKLELPDTPRNRELFQTLVIRMIAQSNNNNNLGVVQK